MNSGQNSTSDPVYGSLREEKAALGICYAHVSNSCEYIFLFLHNFYKNEYLLFASISEFFPLRVNSHLEERQNEITELSPLNVHPFTIHIVYYWTLPLLHVGRVHLLFWGCRVYFCCLFIPFLIENLVNKQCRPDLGLRRLPMTLLRVSW